MRRQPPQQSQTQDIPSAIPSTDSSPFSKRKKVCPFVAAKMEVIDYKDLDTLRQFITERGKILPRRITGVSYYYQKLLKKAIKQARHMALVPFVLEE